MTQRLVALQIRLAKDREAGQGSLEYVGAILVAAVVIGLVIKAFNGADISGFVTSAIDKIKGAGG